MKLKYLFVFFILLTSMSYAQVSSSAKTDKNKAEKKSSLQEKSKTPVDELFEAVEAKNLKKVKQLISAGLSPDAQNSEGVSIIPAMMQRSYMPDRVEIVNYLIKEGVEIRYKSGSGSTMLHNAVMGEMYSTIELLLERKIDTKIQNKYGKPALFSSQSIKMLKFLISKNVGSMQDVDADGDTLLHEAIGFDTDHELLEYLLEYIDINVKNEAGTTVLIKALNLSYFPENTRETVDYLLKKGANVNIAGKYGRSPLLAAFRNGELGVAVIKKLIKAGARMDKKDDDGWQAIHYAAINNLRYVEFLMDKNVDINVQTNEKETPLIVASQYDRGDIVKYLLAHDVNFNVKNIWGKTALNYAQERDFSDLVLMLTEKGAVATEQAEIDKILAAKEKVEAEKKRLKKNEITDLESAIKSKQLEATKKYYIEKINGPDAKKLDMNELAIHTIRKGSLEILKYFLDNGLDVNSKDKDNFSLLHEAVFYNRIDIAKFLIESGLDVNYNSTTGRSIFAMTANSSMEVLELLIKQGLKVDRKKEKRIVSSALLYRNPVMAEHFIKQGYKFNKKILKRKKYLLKVIQHQDTETLSYLLKKGLDIETNVSIYGSKASLLHLAVIIKANEVVDFLLAAGANANARDTYDRPIFYHAIIYSDLRVIEALYDNGADLTDSMNSYNKTPLILAMESDRLNVIHLLIDKGADVNAVTIGANSALHMAAQLGYLDVIKHMVKKGGNVNLLNSNRETPLDKAIKYEEKAVIQYLTEMEAKI